MNPTHVRHLFSYRCYSFFSYITTVYLTIIVNSLSVYFLTHCKVFDLCHLERDGFNDPNFFRVFSAEIVANGGRDQSGREMPRPAASTASE